MSCPDCEFDVIDYIFDQLDFDLLKQYLNDSPNRQRLVYLCELFRSYEIDISVLPKHVRDVLMNQDNNIRHE
jgi:hypothetical protein